MFAIPWCQSNITRVDCHRDKHAERHHSNKETFRGRSQRKASNEGSVEESTVQLVACISFNHGGTYLAVTSDPRHFSIRVLACLLVSLSGKVSNSCKHSF